MSSTSSITMKILNFAAFQIGWFACVLGAARGWPFVGPVAVIVLVLLQGSFLRWQRDLPLLLIAGLLGWGFDSALVLGGVLDFPVQARLGGPSTVWMAFMWVNFATTLNLSLGWLNGRPVLAAIFGALGGPAAYWAGLSLEAVTLPAGLGVGLFVVAVEWAVATPLLLAINQLINRRIGGARPPERGTAAVMERPR